MFNVYAMMEELRTKWGFEDGNMVPAGAEEARSLLVHAFNRLLSDDCPVEAYAYDRDGVHNPYLLLFRRKDGTGSMEESQPDELSDIISILDENNYLYETMSVEIHVSPVDVQDEILKELARRYGISCIDTEGHPVARV
jgi:hypothetical protein